jgi:hypothetical protein
MDGVHPQTCSASRFPEKKKEFGCSVSAKNVLQRERDARVPAHRVP